LKWVKKQNLEQFLSPLIFISRENKSIFGFQIFFFEKLKWFWISKKFHIYNNKNNNNESIY